MNTTFTQQPENANLVQHTLQNRQMEILIAIAHQRAALSPALLEELAELSIALDDMPEVSNDLHQP